MQNLARHWKEWNGDNYVPVPNAQEIFDEVDSIVRKELETAGIEVTSFDFGREGEVPTNLIGGAHSWIFRRAWYYYIAKGPGIPPDIAEEFHQKWGQEVRVAGHCMCPSPKEWCHGFAVGLYHIDTQEGLNAFVELLASIDTNIKENEDE